LATEDTEKVSLNAIAFDEGPLHFENLLCVLWVHSGGRRNTIDVWRSYGSASIADVVE